MSYQGSPDGTHVTGLALGELGATVVRPVAGVVDGESGANLESSVGTPVSGLAPEEPGATVGRPMAWLADEEL